MIAFFRFAVFIFIVLHFSVCDAWADGSFEGYLLGPQDQIKVSVYGENNLSDTYSIDGKGFISMPLIGEVPLSGVTVRDAEIMIAAQLADGYLIDPSVSIEIAMYRPFYILGEVRTPGSYPYIDHISVLKAVALAGGFTYRANRKRVEILRGGEAESEDYESFPPTAEIRPGDIIMVKERFF